MDFFNTDEFRDSDEFSYLFALFCWLIYRLICKFGCFSVLMMLLVFFLLLFCFWVLRFDLMSKGESIGHGLMIMFLGFGVLLFAPEFCLLFGLFIWLIS